ncbi:hypothetical protein GOP47_0003969 [Adiantum capillus-veneris]|uniref:Small ribosomal subunit protein bS18c n=1 Tax=Adiantum capillus-veneris TaxID=13818 RepID=A0A9D4ZPA3_ADICA|nr:hypothetical protein GOP47_0003969 [Adiantum capillus-veneris]
MTTPTCGTRRIIIFGARSAHLVSTGIEHTGALSFHSSFRCKHGHQYDLKRPSGGFTIGRHPTNCMPSNTYMVSQRHFAKGRDDDDDEDILDDVESRLMREDYEGDGRSMDYSSHGIGGANFDDYGEWTEASSEVKREDGAPDEEKDSDEEGLEEGSDEDSELDPDEDSDTLNEQSDEEFEDEQTDEEFDELLAGTPLFDPPDIEFLRPEEPIPEFSFRPEGPVYYPGMEYEPEELDVTRPLPPRKREERAKEEISVQEAIDKADFRNVRFLTKFIDETGYIIARKEFTMRNKSHNRVVRAIKTARFFGLMPYTNMGRPKFVFNEPFDEFSEFYSTDEDENVPPTGWNTQGRFNNTGRRDGRNFAPGPNYWKHFKGRPNCQSRPFVAKATYLYRQTDLPEPPIYAKKIFLHEAGTG